MTASVSDVQLFSPEYYQNPYSTFARLREHSPVHEFRFPVGDVRTWMVTRYDDVRDILADDRFSPEGGTWGNAEFKAAGLVTAGGTLLERALTLIDPPAHTRIRRLAMSAFTPRRMAQWRDTVNEAVSVVLDRCAALGSFDAMDDFAGAVSAEVLAQILGFPVERHAELGRVLALAFPSDPELIPGVPAAFGKICEHAQDLVAEKRGQPGDDLTSAFVQAHEVDDRLSEDELVTLAATLVLAGVDTVRGLLGNAVLALLDHPDQVRLLLSQPDVTTTAVEELLRFEGSLTIALFRLTTQEVKFRGTAIPAGSPVMAALQSANRDPARYDDPDRLDLTRKGARHLSLGHGIHNCLGAALARLETEIAIPALFTRFPDIALAVPREEIRYDENWASRRLAHLPVTTSPGG